MAKHNAGTTPGVSVHATGASAMSSSVGGREFGVAPSRGDGGGMSVLLSWHEKVGSGLTVEWMIANNGYRSLILPVPEPL